MSKHANSPQKPKSKGVRIGRNVSFPPDQDAWLTSLLGERGNLSGFIQGLVELARSGKIDTKELLRDQPESDSVTRAARYLKAKEAAMLFEEDAVNAVIKTLGRGQRVVRGRIFNDEGPLFIADVCIESAGELVASVVCKSSPRPDRLQLALAEAMIGQQKTGKPVITVVPYLLTDKASAEVAEQYRALGYQLTTIAGLQDALRAVK